MRDFTAAAIATLTGFAVMSLELTAVRLLAPHFGDSAYVWTNVIGVMLAALAVGAWLGGRLAGSERGADRLAAVFVITGVLVCVVPLLGPVLGGWLLPQDLALDGAMSALVRGSLAATIVLFAPPVLLLGCVTPILVTLLAADGRVGRAAGLVGATSTLGSLVGTFVTTHALVPGVGSRVTLWICAAAILACAPLARQRAASAAVLLLPLVLGLLPWGPLRAPAPGENLLAEVESAYQFLQVVATGEDEERAVQLRINEGLDSFHSIKLAGTAWTGGRYYDYHTVVPFLVGDGARPTPLRVLSLGAAAGTFARVFAAAHPGCRVDGVEIDPDVVRLGNEYFGGRVAPGAVWGGLDARVFVEASKGIYDVVLVDAYERQAYIPAHVASSEFFTSLRERLAPKGIVSVNAGGRRFDDPVVGAIGSTMRAVFGAAWAFRVPGSRNFMLLARRDAPLRPDVLVAELAGGDERLAAVLAEAGHAGAWRELGGEGAVLTDDRPLLDGLQWDALSRPLETSSVTVIAGATGPGAAEGAARAALAERDYEAALAAVRGASAENAVLRALAGDARWLLHDLPGALLEYRAGLRLRVAAEMQEHLQQRVTSAEEEIARLGHDRARGLASRSGWVAAIASLCLLAGAWGVCRARA